MTGEPFEFLGYDALGYHNEANWIIELFNANRLDVYVEYIRNKLSDMGYPVFLSLIYYIFGNQIITPRIANAFLGAIMCILIYKLGRRNFGESSGRISAIISMLLPNFIYYTGLHMKETLMLTITVAFIERADYLFKARIIKFKNISITIILGIVLFFFRTVLGIVAFLSIITTIFLVKNKSKINVRRIILSIGVILTMLLIFSTSIFYELHIIVEKSNSNQDMQMENYATREGGNRLAVYGTKSIFFALILIAPLPTLVHSYQDNAEMINGALFTRNVYAFFVLIALFVFYKRKKFRQHILILSFLFGYLCVLALSGFALSERFHLPAVPFLVILAGYGITQLTKKSKRLYIIYLVSISILIIGWNWFKLAGRGL